MTLLHPNKFEHHNLNDTAIGSNSEGSIIFASTMVFPLSPQPERSFDSHARSFHNLLSQDWHHHPRRRILGSDPFPLTQSPDFILKNHTISLRHLWLVAFFHSWIASKVHESATHLQLNNVIYYIFISQIYHSANVSVSTNP
jgi:hypothetical protein